jgi:hypothetical protein
MRILIIEGVTGAGKSETLRALARQPAFAARLGPGRVISEEDTLGEVMDEIAQFGGPPARHVWRLDRVMAALERESKAAPEARFVLERFHLSYYALLPDWTLYETYERALERLGCASVLLTVDPSALAERSLERADRRGTGWTEGMIAHYGSRDAALAAIARSQQRRLDALALTRLPTLVIDTTGQAWDAYAQEILSWWRKAD